MSKEIEIVPTSGGKILDVSEISKKAALLAAVYGEMEIVCRPDEFVVRQRKCVEAMAELLLAYFGQEKKAS